MSVAVDRTVTVPDRRAPKLGNSPGYIRIAALALCSDELSFAKEEAKVLHYL